MICDRCHKETNIHTMSMFNTDEICMACKDAERKHPDYDDAQAADIAAVRSGNFNFAGIGWPR